MVTEQSVKLSELRLLMYHLRDHQPDIGIRFRLIGEMWQKNFAKIITLTNEGIVIRNEIENQLTLIPDLRSVMQFEIDHRFQQYQPYYHYTVDLPTS